MESSPTILFDGDCNLCNRTVQIIIKWDKKAIFQFASFDSHYAHSLLRNDSGAPNSVLLVHESRILDKSDAVLQILHLLGYPARLFCVLSCIYKPWRDTVYEWIARNRTAWFGKAESCWVITEDLESRFRQ